MQNITFELVEEIFKVSRLMKDEMSFSSALMHLSALQFHVLIYVKKNNAVTMSDIASYFRIELPSATSLIRTLIKLKLVERNTDDHDRRLVMITLSREGKIILEDMVVKQRVILEAKLAFLSSKDQQALLQILKNLHLQLEK